MRTVKAFTIGAVLVFTTACAGIYTEPRVPYQEPPTTSAEPSGETLGERIERLKAEESKKAEGETERDRVLRLRAEQIRMEKEQKKARENAKRNASPEMRQAIAELEKSEKIVKEQREALIRAEVSGCDTRTMWVNPKAVPHSSISSTVKVRVFNPGEFPVNIDNPHLGPVVRGLCPGGIMTLFRARSMIDPDFLQFWFIAFADLPDGRMGMDQSQTYRLSKYDWSSGGGRQEYEWVIVLRPVR